MAGVEMLLYMSLLTDGCNRDHYYLMAGVEMLLYMSYRDDVIHVTITWWL